MTNKEAIEKLREILAEAIEFENSVCYVTEEDREPLEMAIEALKNQKTGRWEETTLANGRKGMKCSNCGCEPIEDALYGYVYSDYCPSCGAKMEGE